MFWPPTSPLIGWGQHRLHPTRASSLISCRIMSEGEDETRRVSVFAVHASSPSSTGKTDRVKHPDKCAVWMFVKFPCESDNSSGILQPLKDRSERRFRFPPLLTAGSLSANFRCRRQHSVMFCFSEITGRRRTGRFTVGASVLSTVPTFHSSLLPNVSICVKFKGK